MKNFTNNFKQFTSRLSARWLIMALMLLVGTSSAWGANLASGQVIQFKFSQGSVQQSSGWNGTVLNIWDNNNHSEQVNVQPGEVYTITEGHWIPTKFQYLSQYDLGGWKGQTAEIGDCGGGSTLLTNKMYEVTLSTSTDWTGNQYQNYPNKQFKHTLSCEDADLCKPTYYIAGTLPGASWNEGKHLEMTTCDRGLRSLTFNGVAEEDYEFKITQGNWSWSTGSYHTDKGNLKCVSYDGNIKISTKGLGQTNVTIYFDGNKAYASYTAACFTINDLDITASKTTICDGESVTLTLNNKQSDVTYKIGNTTIFNSNDAKPTYNTGAITGVSSKSYKIDATATGQCEAKTKTFTIEVTDLPSAPTDLGSATICNGDPATLPEVTGSWYANTTTPLESRVVKPEETTSYFATAKEKGCESSTRTEYVVKVKSLASANNYELTSATAVYTGTAVTLQTSDVNVTNNAGTVSTIYFKQNGNTVNPINVGDYEVYVTTAATDDICASDIKIGTFTITQATQTGFKINNTTLNICGTSVVVTSTGGQGGDVTYSIQTDNTTTKDATINRTTGELKVNSAGTVIVTATKAATTNYKEATNPKEFTFIMLPNVALTETSISVCSNEEINLSEYVNEYSGTIKWYSDSEYNTEITELNFIPNNQIYYVKATNGECTPATAELDVKVTQVPAQPELDTVDPQCDSYTLPTEDKKGLPIKWYDSNGSVLASNTIIQSGTYYAEGVNGNCVSESRTEVEVTINNTPTITGKSVTQPDTEITLTSTQGVTWSVSPTENVILTDNDDGTATFSASVVGEFVVSAQKENCSTEYTITVTDKGNIIYVRRPKSEDGNNYTYWYNSAFMGEEYYGTQNYIKNGADYSTAYENNQNGTAPTLSAAFTDCDGYVWDKFEVLGYESFFVHAPVQTGFGGLSTFTQKIDVALGQPEMYVTIGTWSYGLEAAPLTTVEAPSLVKVHASGETTLGANKFAALYVTDCSGREIDAYQWEYCSPESSKYVNYTASVSNSGTLYSGDAGTTNNIRPSDAGFYRCTVTYKGGGTATSAAKEVTGTYSYLESNIPVIVVNTNGVGFPDCPSTGGTASKNADVLKEKRSVDVKIYDGTTLVYDRKARMNYRGSSSLNFQKKSYAFCPGKDNCVEDKGRQDYVKTEKMNMLGVGSAVDKDWVLYASAADPTLMRNRLVFDTYKAMRPDDWSVQSRYVELIVDGEHKGVYVLMDKITKNDNRVKLNEENGFIVKFDKTDCADRFGGYNNIWGDEKTFITTYTGHDYVSTYDTHIDQRFEIEYPEKDDYTIGWSSKVKSIQAMFQAFEDALKAGEYATVQKYIDYDSWADWFIINEYTKNVDAYRASCIFVYTGEDGAKIEARPLWDQELSFNNQCPNYMSDYGSNDATGFLIQENKVHEQTEKHIAAPFWFTGDKTDITGGLLSDPCFVQIVKEKWSKYSTASGPLTKDVLMAKIGEYTTELGAAQKREAEYWKTHSRSTLSCPWDNNTTGYNNTTTVTASLSSMETWFASRGTGLTNAINGLTGSSFSIEIMPYTQNVTPWTSANVAIIVKPEGYDYKLEYIGENDLSSVANAIIEQEGDNITYRIPRPTEWGTGNAVEGERANIEYIIKATLNVQERTSVCGSQAAPTSTAIIKLIDEENDNCQQP